jgi:nucleotide-binding universal stress UspA family protein
MYRRVLATVNEFSNSEVAARYAIICAKACGASLVLLYVDEKRADSDAFNRAEASLKRLFLESEAHGVEIESITESGVPLRKIAEVVRREKPDVVFTSTRRDDLDRRYFARTLSKELLLRLPCAVALVRIVHVGKTAPKRILLPLQGRIAGLEERAYFAAKLAEGYGADLTLFHVSGGVAGLFREEHHMPPREREERLPADVGKFVQQLNRYSIAHDRRTGRGSISHSIAVEAMIRRNDLIVMGSSERGLLKSMLYGNPVEEIMRETPCNLIVFRAGIK